MNYELSLANFKKNFNEQNKLDLFKIFGLNLIQIGMIRKTKEEKTPE